MILIYFGKKKETQNFLPSTFGYIYFFSYRIGRAIAQAVTRWLPIVAARVRVRAKHVLFVADKVALGQVFSEYFGFPCQSIPPISPSS
jgi:hypothetical protein